MPFQLSSAARALCLLRIVAALAARDRVLTVNIDANCAPGTVTSLVSRPVTKRVNHSQIHHHAFISARQVLQLLSLVKTTATNVGQFFHAVMGEVERLLLNIAGTQRLITLCIRPNRIDDTIE